jgi:hypothetical protein
MLGIGSHQGRDWIVAREDKPSRAAKDYLLPARIASHMAWGDYQPACANNRRNW